MSNDDAFFRDLAARLRRLAPDVPAQRVDDLTRDLRAAWGGARIYIARHGADARAARLGAALRTAPSVRAACEAAGIAPRTGYRLLTRRPRRG